MTYRAWEQKPLDRTAVRELTAAIAEQAAAQLEEQAMDEAPWSDEKYKAVLAAQQKENALLAGILAARGITDPAEALTLLAGEEELSDPALLTDMDAACQRIWQAIDNGETIAVFGTAGSDRYRPAVPAPQGHGRDRQVYATQPRGGRLRPVQKRHPVHAQQGLHPYRDRR